jgi:site-specific DNA recombinase
VGALAHLLKSRFYIGEVVYRGHVRRGEHEPILDRALFEAVEGKLAAQGGRAALPLRGSPALLTGRMFDANSNRMSPSHSNKGGARYRYYISQAVLQKKPGRPDRSAVFPRSSLRRSVINTQPI